MGTLRSRQTDVRREILSLARTHLSSCATITTLALQIRNPCNNYVTHPVSPSNMQSVIFRQITLLEIPPLFFFLSVMHIMPAHGFLIELEFDFSSQCCDGNTFWTSCPARLYQIPIYHPHRAEDKHPDVKMSRFSLDKSSKRTYCVIISVMRVVKCRYCSCVSVSRNSVPDEVFNIFIIGTGPLFFTI